MKREPCSEILLGADPSGLALQRQAMFELPGAADARVVCLEGAVWITLDNDTRDFVLEPCEVFTTTEHRRAIVYALKPSRISVTRTSAERRAPVEAVPHRKVSHSATWSSNPTNPFNPALAASAIWG